MTTKAITYCVKVNLPGGVVSAGDMFEILIIAAKAGATDISIGNRQQLYFDISADLLDGLEMDMMQAELSYEVDTDNFPNIISSYVTDAIFNTESWLKEGVYKDIFDMFSHKPRLKINLVDCNQTFVLFFSGNMNFISSPVSNYWYFYIRFPKTNYIYCWPSLVYSADIPEISKVAEEIIFENKHLFYDQPEVNPQPFYEMVTANNSFSEQAITETLKLPDFYLPYYEGFNQYINNKYWLGIYRRNELFSISFLKDICELCISTRVGQLYTTPWKSLIVKGISDANRKDWGAVLNKYQINIRHAANELNWQTENLYNESLVLKKELVRIFEEHDLRTYRLCFAIKMQPKTGLSGSVIIRKQAEGVFDVLHSRDFNPNYKDLVLFKSEVPRNELAECLIALCGQYYHILSHSGTTMPELEPETEEAINLNAKPSLYQCKYCLTVYDEQYGEPDNGIVVQTAFEDIPHYTCPVCEAPKGDFLAVEKTNIFG